MPQFRQSLTIELVEGAQFTIEQISYQQQAYYFNAQRFFFSIENRTNWTHLIGITICSFHVGLEPSTVDVRNVLSRNVAVTNGLTLA